MHRRSLLASHIASNSANTISCNTSSFRWMLNKDDKNPCDLVQDVLRMCKPGLKLERLPKTLSCDASNDSGNCCCSTATYALLSACWVCRGNNIDDIERNYEAFFLYSHCEEPSIDLILPSVLKQQEVDDLSFPPWSLLPPPSLTAHWNITAAETCSASSFATSISYISRTSMSSTSRATGTKTVKLAPASIAAAVLGALAGIALVAIVGWFLLRWHRRRLLRVDLTSPGVERKGSHRGLDLLSGEQDNSPRSPTFPFPFEWFFRRYHPDAPHSIEPRSEYGEAGILPTRQIATQLSAPLPVHKSNDQLDRDLARLSGTVTGSSPGKNRTQKVKRIPRLSISRRDGSGSQNSSGSINSDSRRGRHHSRKSKGKYHHLPPSAQYLADVARYPQNVDPERPWVKPRP